ncbi:hypothetical protein BDN70DRAFT_820656 [Pholiota conissans]|uniref:Uncharacterized protein n=1 Tax=Pholiota conissans TaxID=109636 RepID=A0A9P6CSV7_9AGAR|nr:hypothetical protein BDN70DRAFT_820656 [Pholiota conissans]
MRRFLRTPLPILDAFGRIIAVPAGRPNDKDWDVVRCGAAGAVDKCRKRCRFPKKSRVHRRGKFPALNVGISYGGGQKKPGNLYHSAQNKEALSALIADKNITRIAKYANSAFATWAPNMYTYYEDHFEPLLEDDPTLHRNWPGSVWASFAVNFGPRTACQSHRDFANLPFGWCAITSLGDFDAKKGGHLVLWDLKLVIEFPPGSTILIPSSVITHSNVPVGRRKTRYSVTQFSAGGLFRWVDQGLQCTNNYMSKLTGEGMEEDLKQQEERCKLGLTLFSTMDSLPADCSTRNRLARSLRK